MEDDDIGVHPTLFHEHHDRAVLTLQREECLQRRELLVHELRRCRRALLVQRARFAAAAVGIRLTRLRFQRFRQFVRVLLRRDDAHLERDLLSILIPVLMSQVDRFLLEL